MNQRTDNPFPCGRLAELLQRAPRKKARALPLPSESEDESAAPQSAKVLGPCRNGGKWRLLVFDPHRQAKVFDDYETAVRVRDRLLVEMDGRSKRTIADVVEESLAHKHNRGCIARSIRTVRGKLAWLPMDSPLQAEVHC